MAAEFFTYDGSDPRWPGARMVWGVEFKEGVPTEVQSEALQSKLLALGGFTKGQAAPTKALPAEETPKPKPTTRGKFSRKPKVTSGDDNKG